MFIFSQTITTVTVQNYRSFNANHASLASMWVSSKCIETIAELCFGCNVSLLKENKVPFKNL